MATLADFRNERLKKLARLRELGINPYPAQSHRSVKIGPLLAEFDQRVGSTVTVAGRITAIRSFGKIAFIRLTPAELLSSLTILKTPNSPVFAT